MYPFINGISACSCLIAGVLFFRFWRDTHDRLFMWFAFAFWMFAVNWSAVAFVSPADEARHLYFLPRLAGFVLILLAIVDKNRARRAD
jgi:hypothetical protein